MNHALLELAFTITAILLMPVIAFAIARALGKISAYLGVKLDSAQDEQIRRIASDAALYAEEWAATKLKLGHDKPTGDDKMNTALAELEESLPGLSAKTAQALVKAVLPRLGLGAMGSR